MSVRAVIYCLLLVIFLLGSACERKHPDWAVHVPDQEFLKALIDEGVDQNGDGYISFDEAESVTSLDFGGKRNNKTLSCAEIFPVFNLKGIEAFMNLDSLDCTCFSLKTLILSNPSLTYLKCVNNQLEFLDVTQCKELEHLECHNYVRSESYGEIYNTFQNLDLSGNLELMELDCGYTPIQELDLTMNLDLQRLHCAGCELTELDVFTNTTLEELHAYGNHLTTIDVSSNRSLVELGLGDNLITQIDVSGNPLLEFLALERNQLQNLNISVNTRLRFLLVGLMPSLTEICVWTMPFPPEGLDVNSWNSPNIYFTTDCSQ